MWDLIIEKGKEFNIRVGCPNMIERVENNLLSYGNEMTNKDTPYDCGLGNFCNLDTDYEFIGKSALLKQKKVGFAKDIYKIQFDFKSENKQVFFNNLPVFKEDVEIGRATSIVWSPKHSKYVGFLIASKNIMNNLNDYYILDKVNFDLLKIILIILRIFERANCFVLDILVGNEMSLNKLRYCHYSCLFNCNYKTKLKK